MQWHDGKTEYGHFILSNFNQINLSLSQVNVKRLNSLHSHREEADGDGLLLFLACVKTEEEGS